MSQRNMLCTHQVNDVEMEPADSHFQPEPSSLFGDMVDFPNANSHPVLPLSGNMTNYDHHPMDYTFYGNQYNNLQHNHPIANLGLGGTGPSNLSYNSYIIPSAANRICPLPLNHGSSDYMPSASNHGVFGIGIDEYGRNHHFMDNVRGSCKRKNAEGLPGSYYYVNAAASSSSSSLSGPLNSGFQQWEEPFVPRVGVLDAATFSPAEYRGSGVLSITEEPQRSVRSRSGAISPQLDSAVAHHHGQLLQGSHIGQSFQSAGGAWPEQFGNNGGNGGTSSWNYGPSMPNMHGRSINGGPPEIGSMIGQGYQDAASNRNSGIILHPSSMHHQPPQNMQGMRGHTYSYSPQIPAPSYRHPTNNLHHGNLNPSRDGPESASRYSRSFASNGDRLSRPHRRASQAALDDINGRMRLLSSDDVAMLEFSGFYGVGNFIDHHRDMRLDIDDMSYEELLALEERIGDVSTGLSEDTVLSCLKTRNYVPCEASLPPGCSAGMDMQENGTCIICQVEYEANEKIGILDCGHDYHADCVKQWLMVKNICPICKTSAFSVDKKDE
eukprot:TRINITY_DN586_c0_g1_i1.p1 TRINITY_DN586_c0_g1~~TRINITY_DN586_c0_g1_i1.p1  ORF type:complete len:552 (-),score=121.26 TRINITY_DN586_c0_g1_i1:210-1865(-)